MALKLAGVSFAYGNLVALSEVSLELDSGVTALLGVNGAGKSTMLSIAAGILPPGTGTAEVSGRSLFDRRDRKAALRAVSLMPQAVTFPSRLTAHDVVSYLGWLKGMPGGKAARRATECLAAVGLASKADSPCGSLSGGDAPPGDVGPGAGFRP